MKRAIHHIRLKFILILLLLQVAGHCLYAQSANFNSSLTEGCAPILVQFTDLSAGNPAQWKWDLGNGTVSYQQHPSVTYFLPGIYTVKLMVETGTKKDSVIKTNYIKVYAAPVVDFIVSATTGCNTLSVLFTDKSTAANGNIARWQWDTGDGVLIDQTNPSYTYNRIGEYNVSLKVTDSKGCAANKRVTAAVKINGIKAAFNTVIPEACKPSVILFESTVTGNGTFSYRWNFGDGSSSALAKPQHTYAAGGTYTATLLADNGLGCTAITEKIINVQSPVSAAFSAAKTFSCKVPFDVDFITAPAAGNTYAWSFGDSSMDDLAQPIHTYNDTGFFTIKLLVKNNKGCMDSVEKQGYIRAGKQNIFIANLPDSSCAPFTKKIITSINPGDSIISYHWDFGDGFNSASPLPVHVYTADGNYDVRLQTNTAAGCSDTLVVPNAIRISTKPTAAFEALIRDACAKQEIIFTDKSTGTVTGWDWDFGKGENSQEQNPAHTFRDTGFIDITLVAKNGGCTDTVTQKKYIYIKPAVAGFTVITQCGNPLVRKFTNSSKGADQWLWDFGDGSFSTEYSPVHTYAGSGTYLVILTVSNNRTGCEDQITKKVIIAKAAADFMAADTELCKGTSTLFTGIQQADSITRFIWNFGDGNIVASKQDTISHVYDKAGVYDVRLIAVNAVNCRDTMEKIAFIKVNGPTALFAPARTGNCVNTNVLFIDSSYMQGPGNISKWEWDYDDGNKDTLTAPPFDHRYTRPGRYFVKLTTTDINGCSNHFELPNNITIANLKADLLFGNSYACTKQLYRMVCPQSEFGFFYNWDFGDGNSATTQYAQHSYALPGVYTVKLVLGNGEGCTDSVYHNVKVEDPAALFSVSDTFSACPPLIAHFKDASSNAVQWLWNFGDGTSTTTNNPAHFYTMPGTYTATLTVTGRGACTAQHKQTIIVEGPTGSLNYDTVKLCVPFKENFTAKTFDAVSYIWDFNDGSTVSNMETAVAHVYTDAGNFQPRIILIDKNGCRVPITGEGVIRAATSAAGYTLNSKPVCDTTAVNFINTSAATNDSIIQYHWNFGDGNASSDKHPAHLYQAEGNYFPALTIRTSFGCTDTFIAANPVAITHSPRVTLSNFSGGCAPLLLSEQAHLQDSSAPVQWHWTFSNGHAYTLQHPPPLQLDTAGNYTINVTVTAASGCSTMLKKTVEVMASPKVFAGNDTAICRGRSIQLGGTGAQRYQWTSLRQGLHEHTADIFVQPDSSSTYVLTGTNNNGCSATDMVQVNVMQRPLLQYGKNEFVCRGSAKKLSASGAAVYSWQPTAGLSNAAIADPLAQPDSSTNYRVIGTDEKFCFADTGYILVKVFKEPLVNAGEDKTINAGEPMDLVPQVSEDVSEINWYPTSGIFRNSDAGITVKPAITTEYTVEVKNAGGCRARDKVNVFVLCDGANIFIPNTFSPDGNGSNEIFYPRGKGLYKIKSLRLYSRWGQVVFTKDNFMANDASAGWDGTFKGVKMNADVFVYIAEVMCSNSSVLTLKGNVALVK